MATVMDFVNQVRSNVTSTVPTLTAQVSSSDYRLDLDDIPSGQTRYRMKFQEQQSVRDSNSQIQTVAMELIVGHHLASRYNERAYTEANMLTQMASLMDKDWWRVASVREVTDAPQLEQNVERVGNIISWSVLVNVAITP